MEKGIWTVVVRIPHADVYEVPVAGFTQSRHQCHMALMRVCEFIGVDPRIAEVWHMEWTVDD